MHSQRSEEFPYTHPFGEIRSFAITVLDGVTFVITAGGEGLIRTWRFDAAKGGFEQIMVLEGHIRAVTCVLLNGECFFLFLLVFGLVVILGHLSARRHETGHEMMHSTSGFGPPFLSFNRQKK